MNTEEVFNIIAEAWFPQEDKHVIVKELAANNRVPENPRCYYNFTRARDIAFSFRLPLTGDQLKLLTAHDKSCVFILNISDGTYAKFVPGEIQQAVHSLRTGEAPT